MNLCLALIAAGVIITAIKWPFKTALFPMVIGVSVFLMAGAELILSLTERGGKATKHGTLDFQLSEGMDAAVALGRTWVAFGWIVGFFVLILFMGFSFAVPLFVFFYMKIYGKEKWGISILMGALAWVFFYGLFIWLLNTPMMEGWLFRGLRLIGIG
jgi:hypothetical protein